MYGLFINMNDAGFVLFLTSQPYVLNGTDFLSIELDWDAYLSQFKFPTYIEIRVFVIKNVRIKTFNFKTFTQLKLFNQCIFLVKIYQVNDHILCR